MNYLLLVLLLPLLALSKETVSSNYQELREAREELQSQNYRSAIRSFKSCIDTTSPESDLYKEALFGYAEALFSSGRERDIKKGEQLFSDSLFIAQNYLENRAKQGDTVAISVLAWSHITVAKGYSISTIDDISILDSITPKSRRDFYYRCHIETVQDRSFTGDLTKAVELYQMGSLRKNNNAISGLAFCYYWGFGVPRDYNKAYDLFREVSITGYWRSMIYLGRMFTNGQGIGKNLDAAYYWYNRAAEAGGASGMVMAGAFQIEGIGTEKDSVTGTAWVRKSAELGNSDAQFLLGHLYYVMEHRDSITETEATENILLAARNGHSAAQKFCNERQWVW